MGFSSSVVAGVWVGFDQPAPIGPNAYGSCYDLPIWAEFMDPLRVIPISYGKSNPLADNANREGRSKNRRVEILVYKEAISAASSNGDTGPRADVKMPEGSDLEFSAR